VHFYSILTNCGTGTLKAQCAGTNFGADRHSSTAWCWSRIDFGMVVNVASPCPLPNREFMQCLRAAWCTSYIAIPAAEWMLEIGALFLRTETELILKSRRVVPGKLTKAGFTFHFPNWRGASQNLVERWRALHAD
jgi:uncharacterized protein